MSQEILKGFKHIVRPQLVSFVGQTHEIELLLLEETSQACLHLFDSVKDEERYFS